MLHRKLEYSAKFLEYHDVSEYHVAINRFFTSLNQEKFSFSVHTGNVITNATDNIHSYLREVVVTIDCKNITNESHFVNFATHINKMWCKESQKSPYLHWLEPDSSYINSSTFIPYGQMRANEIGFGNLVRMKDFVQSYRFHELKIKSKVISSILCCFDHLLKEVILYISNTHKHDCEISGEMGHKITFKYDSIAKVLANMNSDLSTVEIFIQLKYPPFITTSYCNQNNSNQDLQMKVTKVKEMEYSSEKFQRTFNLGCVCNNTSCDIKQIGKNFVLKLVADDKFQCRWNLEQFSLRCARKTKVCFTSVCTHILKKENKLFSKNIFSSFFRSQNISEFDKFNCEYAWRVVYSRSDFVISQISLKNLEIQDYMKTFLPKIKYYVESNPTSFAKALYFIADMIDKNVMFDFSLVLEKMFDFFCNNKELNDLPQGMTYVRRVLIAPSRTLFLQPYEHFENRIIRKFGIEFMMRVSIQDDDYSKLTFAVQHNSNKEEIMMKIVFSVLMKGIKVGSRNYEFLAASTSQLREHGIWLYAPDNNSNTASSIRQWMGKFSSIKNVAKHMARMGQCLTSTETGVQVFVKSENEIIIPDIKTLDGKYTFSDGIGIISSELAEEVRQMLLQNSYEQRVSKCDVYKPIAFQIRYKGCKGMVVEHEIPGRELRIRPSMKKFECTTSNQLEIVKTSGPTKLFLNKHLITILEQMGIDKEVFLHLEVDMILHLLDSLMDEKVAVELLTHNLSPIFPFRDLQNAGFSLTSDPFFRSLLLAYFKHFSEKLRTHMRIAVPENYGRNMLGVLDETKTLKYGQVFVQYSKSLTDPSAGFKIYTGPVIVTKNPSLHPGDVRKLMAVDVPKLHGIKDCIVFPAQGKRPHPDEMAGSDLDGDEMVVIWYKPLIFSHKNVKPMTYPVYEEKCSNNNIELPDMVNFFCHYIQNDNIGIFAHAHLVWADKLKEGVFSKKCMSIAKRYPYVLDFAKHGTIESLDKSEICMQFPDFMQKGLRKNTYHSRNALGLLYRTSRVLDACSSKINLVCEISSYDCDLEIDGWEKYKNSAELHKIEYAAKVTEILNHYNIDSEAEAFSGSIQLDAIKQWREEQANAFKVLKKYIINIQGYYKSIFLSEVQEEVQKNGLNEKEKLERKYQRASAWYMVVYSQKNDKFLSFPWIISDVLSDIKMNMMKIKKSSPCNIGSFLRDVDYDIKQWCSIEPINSNMKKCLCNGLLEKITTEWIMKSGLNFNRSTDNPYCNSCYERIFAYYTSNSNLYCCSGDTNNACTCEDYCSPTRLVFHFLKFFITKKLETFLGFCDSKFCDGFLRKNLQEISLQTYSYLAITRNICYLGIPFNTNNFTKNAILSDPSDMFEGDPIKISVNYILKEIIEDHLNDVESYLKKKSGVKDITLIPEKHSTNLIVCSSGKNWQRWNLQEILLDCHFTDNLLKGLNMF